MPTKITRLDTALLSTLYRLLCLMLAATVLLAGCKVTIKGDEDTEELIENALDGVVIKDKSGSGGCTSPATTTSGYVLPCGTVLVSPDAADGSDITEALLLALFDLPDDSVVLLPEGSFSVSESIIVPSANGLTLTGHGIGATTLNFSGSSGDDGIRFEGGNNIVIRDMAVLETNKNGIKSVGVNGIHMAYTYVNWAGDLETADSAYGLYPVNSVNVLIEHNKTSGSRDAGIYVGQSRDVVVRNNVVTRNIAGIEIENTLNADVYNNVAADNTAGILAFDFPNLELAYGGKIRIFNNFVQGNNRENVGLGSVGIAPPGTGVLVFAVSDVEIYNNTITDNRTSALAVASYFMNDADVANYPANYGASMTAGWTPMVKNVNMHDNLIARNGANPGGVLIADVIAGYLSPYNASGMPQVFPAVLYGGIGELLSNAGALSPFNALLGPEALADGVNYNAYGASDLICANNNLIGNDPSTYYDVNTGLVYGTNPADGSNWDGSGNPAASLLIDSLANNTYLNCTLNRLSAANVTLKGKNYGCDGDDIAEQACSL